MSEVKTLTVKDTVKNMQPEFAKLLKASGTDVDKFMNNAIMAINDKPDIKSGDVTSKSVFDVCSRAANDGVILDNREAALIIGWNGKTRQKEAQYRLMSGGLMKMISRSPEIERVACQVVHENDDFVVDFVTDKEPIRHTVNPDSLKKGRGEIVGVYFVAKLSSGEWTSPEVMSVEEVNAVRDNYSQKNKEGEFSQMWRNSWGEAARKTVLHRAAKRLPLGDKERENLDKDNQDNSVLDVTDGESHTTSSSEKPKTTRAADKVKASVATEPNKHTQSAPIEAEYEEIPHNDYGDPPDEDESPI